MGRFTSVDPLLASGNPVNPKSWNRYAYALNNPLRLVDPTGLQSSIRPRPLRTNPGQVIPRRLAERSLPRIITGTVTETRQRVRIVVPEVVYKQAVFVFNANYSHQVPIAQMNPANAKHGTLNPKTGQQTNSTSQTDSKERTKGTGSEFDFGLSLPKKIGGTYKGCVAKID